MWRVLLLFVISLPVWALPEARLLSQSSSGKTAVFNLGVHDGVADGDYAVIVKQIRDLDLPDLRLVPVAKARNIKINPDSSVWVLYHIYDQELLIKGDQFLVLSESAMLRGRRDPRLGRITVVDSKDKYLEAAKNVLTDDQDRLAKLKAKYRKFAPAHEREERSSVDFELVDLEKWQDSNGVKSRSALVKSPNNEDFKRNLRLVTFEKIVTGYLKKVNDPEFNYATFYDAQMRQASNNEFKRKNTFENEYDKFVEDEARRKTSDARMYRALLDKGETWSDDFSDEELHVLLNDVSTLQEKDRRAFLISKPNPYVIAFDYGQYLTDGQTDNDTRYRRGSRYALDVNFEVNPFVKHPVLEKFTFDMGVRINRNAFEAENTNANVNEFSASIGANWYPVLVPYTVEAPVFFLGTYIRSGYATVDAPSANETGKYTVLSIPGIRGGMKYNFRNHVGLRIVASMETLKLEQYESSAASVVLPESTNIVEAKVGFGIGYSF